MTGEPLLAPRLEEWVQAARKAKVLDVALVTNGQLLTEDMSVKLIQAGLTKLMVSVDAASEETYRLARPGGSYRSLTENLKAFVAVRKALKSPTPLLRLSFVEMSLNQVDRLKFAEEFGELADWLTFQRYLNVSGREDLHRAFSPLEPRPCLEPLTRLALHADGGLFPCCSDFGRLSPLGRFPERSLKSVWLSPAAQALARDQSQFSNCRLCREAQGLAQKAPNLYKPIASFNKIPSPPPGFPGLDPEGR
jgi:hypothetical protein